MRRNKENKTYKLIILMNIATLCILIFVMAMWVSAGFNIFTTFKETTVEEATVEEANFGKCIDGDTASFFVYGNGETVRFLAIDTPETVKPNTPVQPYGKEASDLTCDLLSNANVIRLEYESDNRVDEYGRVLAWVFVDDVLIQETLLKKGYAEIKYVYGDYKYLNILEEAERVAKDKRLGIWN